MTTRRRWLAGLAAIALVVFTAGTVLGYAGEVAASVTVARPAGQLKCDKNITVRATVLDATGKPISGQPVTWSWKSKVSGQDKILDKKSTTNSNGVATTKVVLACVPGSRVLRAQADDATGTVVLNLTAGGLPNTSTLPTEPAVPSQLPPIGALLAVLALATGGGLVAQRVRVRR
jgi:hypothetical protein